MIEKWKLEINEKWMGNIIQTLSEGGVWIWKDTGLIYKKKDGKLTCTKEAHKEMSEIVGKEFLDKNFNRE